MGGDWKSEGVLFFGGVGVEEIDGGWGCCRVGEIEAVSGLVRWKMFQGW